MPSRSPKIGFRIEIVIEPDESGFHAYCPAFKGLHTCGDTEEEAVENARYAAIAYIQSLIKHGDPIPVGVVNGGGRVRTDGTASTVHPSLSRAQ